MSRSCANPPLGAPRDSAGDRPRPARRRIALGLAAAVLPWMAGPAGADVALFDSGGANARLALNAVAAYMAHTEICFGVPSGAGWCGQDDADIAWLDSFVHARLIGDYTAGAVGRLFGEVSYVAAMTRGDGEMYGYTGHGPEDLFREHLFVGWASDDALPELGTDALKVSWGDQRFRIGDGFLIADGASDLGRRLAYYAGPRKAFKKSTVVRLDTSPVGGAAFLLDSRADKGGTRLAGVDVAYTDSVRGTVGLTWFNVVDDERAPGASLSGMGTVSLRAQGTPFTQAGWRPLFLSGEFVRQTGGDSRVDAHAWYLEAGYTLERAPWTPYVGYRYSLFSGDEPATGDDEAFKPLFSGAGRGWGTWYQGEITSNYLWHSDLRLHLLRASASPLNNLTFSALLYDIDFDVARPGGRDAARELNVFVDWTIVPDAGLSAIFGIAYPHDALSRTAGFGDETSRMFGLYAWASY